MKTEQELKELAREIYQHMLVGHIEDAAELAAKADNTIAELVGALQDLVQANEKWNADVETIIGRHPNWSDAYLDRARAAISAATLASLPVAELQP